MYGQNFPPLLFVCACALLEPHYGTFFFGTGTRRSTSVAEQEEHSLRYFRAFALESCGTANIVEDVRGRYML